MRHGSAIKPPNRFEAIDRVDDREQLQSDPEAVRELDRHPIEYLDDASRSIVSKNDSPDIPFSFSINPYRGCSHGCSYCYARNSHEYLGMNAGLDFETKIVVKRSAPELFREFLSKQNWKPEPIVFSGVTDCYQPAERRFRLTQGCLAVALEFQQPVGIVTKNALVARDKELLRDLAARHLVHVFLSINSLSADLAMAMEPRTSIPAARLRAISDLTELGIPVGVMVAPVIPGLNDSEIPAVLNAARDAGAQAASFTLLRLPLTVEPVFREWLARTQPLKQQAVLGRIRHTRDGKLNNSNWGERMAGRGPIAEQIRALFRVSAKRCGMSDGLPPLCCDRFACPGARQLRLPFDG